MKALNVSVSSMYAALRAVNRHYDSNVKFAKGPESYQDGLRFKLGVKDSSKPGARRGIKVNKDGSPMKLGFACWHVHGHFFDALFSVAPGARVVSKFGSVDAKSGNWQDAFVPKEAQLQYFEKVDPDLTTADLCECQGDLRKPGLLAAGPVKARRPRIRVRPQKTVANPRPYDLLG